MGSAPTPPTPPNPVTTASAQGSANVSTAVANTFLSNPNQVTPYGTSTTTPTGSYSVTQPDGTVSTFPTFTTTQTLSPEQQGLYDQQVQLSSGMNSDAQQLVSTIQDNLSNPITADSLPGLRTSLSVPTLQSSYDQGGSIASGYDPGGSLQSSYASGGQIQNSYASGGQIQSSVPWTAQGTNAPSTFGQTATSIQGDVSLNNQTPTTFGQTAQGIQYGLGNTDFTADRDAATNAALARLAPSMAAQQEALNANLANQGLAQGSAAWNAAQLSQNQANNDLRLGAVATGDAEQQALFGERATQNQLWNAAQQQDYTQQQGRGLFGMQATAQNNAATLAAGQFHDAAQQQDFGQLLDRANYAQNAYGMDNAAIAGNNAAALNAGNFANAAQLQGETENANRAAFANQAQAQGEQENAARAAFNNATQAAQNQENAAAAAFSNQAQAQRNSQNQGAAAFSNNAATGLFGMNQAAATFHNQAREQDLTDQETINNNAINQAAALMHGGQVTTGQYQPYSSGQIGQTPISADTYASASEQEQQYQAQMQADAQSNSALWGGLTGLFGMGGNFLAGRTITPSDRRLKRDITPLGAATNGLPVYAFRYVWDADDAPLTIGHMADEVAAVRPDAVHRMPAGYLAVDYGAL